jgi:predicted RNA-binding protein YlxR (DUF448 family)
LAKKTEPTTRTCIVTRQSAPTDDLIRFVLAPDGTVVADLRHRLPGRGVWVTADAAHVRRAEEKRLFARGFGEPVKVEPGLADRVGEALAAAAMGALSLARKAGSVTAGFAKVEAAIAGDAVIALIHAAEAAPDGVARLDSAMWRRFRPEKLPVIRCFTGEQLDLAFGRTNVIHAALLAGPASQNALARLNAFVRYASGDGDRTDTNRPLPDVAETSAGP